MKPTDVATLYFQKAESTRANMLNFRATSVVGYLFVIVALLFESTFLETVRTPHGAFGSFIVLMVVFIAIVLFNVNFKMNYLEYKTGYYRYFAIHYINKYVSSFNTPYVIIRNHDIDIIATEMTESLGFDYTLVKRTIEQYLRGGTKPKFLEKVKGLIQRLKR